MLNKGLHSERQVISRKSQVENTYDLLLATYNYTNPQKDLAYGVNQTKIEKESLATQKPASKNFLHLFEGEYSGVYSREEGVKIVRSIPNLPNQAFLLLLEKGVNSSQMQTTQLILTTSSVFEGDMFINNLTFKQKDRPFKSSLEEIKGVLTHPQTGGNDARRNGYKPLLT